MSKTTKKNERIGLQAESNKDCTKHQSNKTIGSDDWKRLENWHIGRKIFAD